MCNTHLALDHVGDGFAANVPVVAKVDRERRGQSTGGQGWRAMGKGGEETHKRGLMSR